MTDDLAALQSILDDALKCGGPRLWHIEELVKMLMHMRRLLDKKIEAKDIPDQRPRRYK